MTICENEPAELPKDVVRCNDKLDDGQINVNLVNIKERFEMASQRQQRDLSQTTIIDKPSINIRKTLLAFESKSSDSTATNSPDQINSSIQKPQTIVSNSIKQIANGFLSNSIDTSDIERTKPSPIPARRTGSLMMRLQRYESRIAGNSIDDDDDDDSGEDNDDEDDDGAGNDNCDKNRVGIESTSDLSHSDSDHSLPVNIKKNDLKKNKVQQSNGKDDKVSRRKNSEAIISSNRPKLFVDLSSLKNQWESGQIVNKRIDSDEEDDDAVLSEKQTRKQQDEELRGIRMSLARKKEGESVSIKNIYENAIKQKQQDRSVTSGDSLRGIGKAAFNNFKEEFLNRKQDNSNHSYANGNSTQTTNKTNGNINDKNDFSSLKFKTNELKQRFELGIVSNSLDDSDDDSDNKPISKLEQLRQDKLEDLSVFTEGEIKAREARSLFQQIDKSLTVGNGFSTKH